MSHIDGHTLPSAGYDVAFDDMNDLRMSEAARPLYEHVKKFIAEHVAPMSEKFHKLGEGREDRWSYVPGQLEMLEEVKNEAKKQGLWNFFLPDAETGEGLSNLDYAFIAVELGKVPLASECMNCSAPDTGNMEVLERVGTPEQKEMWLKPLLEGKIRSAFAMTEPWYASSDAKNVSTSAVLENGEWVINGEKYYISGAGRPALQDHDHHGEDLTRRCPAQAAVSDPRASRHAPAFTFSDRCMCSAMMTRRTGICTSSSTMCACLKAICCSARAAASRSPSCALGQAGSTTACAPSGRRKRRST